MHGGQATHLPPTSSGGKRSCTALGSRTHALSTTSGSSCRTRDWANLGGDGPTGLIAELVLAGDVADYVRFRAVCRVCAPPPHDSRHSGLDSRFFPRWWIMLDTAFSSTRRHRFLNVSTGECIRMDLPELDEHRLLSLTPEGLLLLFHQPSKAIRLLNPLTRQLTDLPPVTTLQTEKDRAPATVFVHGVGLDDDTSTVAVCFDSLHLVDNARELLLVHRAIYHDPQLNLKRKDDVYWVDLDARALVPVEDLNFKVRAVFMGRRRSISVATEVFPSLTADTLYLGFDIYSFAYGRRSNNDNDDDDDEMVHTSSVVDCLSYCIRGMGEQLA
ncbi:hypothetical protein EJB05_57195, partial [Eragrostis curvula]